MEDIKQIPQHIAIICDGNRRYAKSYGFFKEWGHKKGVDNVDALTVAAKKLGIKFLTFWVLSTENRTERPDEYEYMIKLAREMLKGYKEKFVKEKVKFKHIGRKDRFPQDIVEQIADLEQATQEFDTINVTLAADYGGRDEIIRATKKLVEQNLEITEENISKNLDTKDLPDPEIIVRTGGRDRLSGFMPWQGVYSEIVFSKSLFPAFDENELKNIINYYMGVERNFGK